MLEVRHFQNHQRIPWECFVVDLVPVLVRRVLELLLQQSVQRDLTGGKEGLELGYGELDVLWVDRQKCEDSFHPLIA